MVRIHAKKATGESIGSDTFSPAHALSSVFTWLASRVGVSASDISIRLPSGKHATHDGSANVTIGDFLGDSVTAGDDTEVTMTVNVTAPRTAGAAIPSTAADANELIRALFRQGAGATAAATARPHVGGGGGGVAAAPLSRAPPVQRKTGRSAAADPEFDPAARAHLSPEEQARLADLDENLATALEYAPEQFGQVQMLFVACEINKCPITAFVDSGAQMSFMSAATAERCDLTRLTDTRAPFTGIAQGVGEQKIVGTIHMVPLNAKGLFIPFSFRVLEKLPYDIIIGLDQLRRHQMIVNLADGQLHIGNVALPFLSEWEVAQAAKAREEDKKAQELVAKEEEKKKEEGREEGKAAKTEACSHATPPSTSPAPPASAGAASATPPSEAVPVDGPVATPQPAAAPTASASAPATGHAAAAAGSLSPEAQDERIQQLLAFTGLENVDDARALLDASGWDLEAAAALFFEE